MKQALDLQLDCWHGLSVVNGRVRPITNQADKSNATKKARLLLVDDEPTIRAALERLLRMEGYEVALAANGQEALQRALEWPIDLVLLDVNVATESGWEISQRLSIAKPELPIVMITARPDEAITPAVAYVGALMEKPLDLPLLLTTVQKLLSASPAAS
jgi:two-component system, OmpR family, response regulator MprA